VRPLLLDLFCGAGVSSRALSVTGHGVGAGNGQRERFRRYTGRLPRVADDRRRHGH